MTTDYTDFTDFTDKNPDSYPCNKRFVSASGAEILAHSCGPKGQQF